MSPGAFHFGTLIGSQHTAQMGDCDADLLQGIAEGETGLGARLGGIGRLERRCGDEGSDVNRRGATKAARARRKGKSGDSGGLRDV